MLRKAFLPPYYVVCLLFSFRIFMVSVFAFKPLIHPELILLYSMRVGILLARCPNINYDIILSFPAGLKHYLYQY